MDKVVGLYGTPASVTTDAYFGGCRMGRCIYWPLALPWGIRFDGNGKGIGSGLLVSCLPSTGGAFYTVFVQKFLKLGLD